MAELAELAELVELAELGQFVRVWAFTGFGRVASGSLASSGTAEFKLANSTNLATFVNFINSQEIASRISNSVNMRTRTVIRIVAVQQL